MRLSPARVSAEGRLLGGRAQALTKLGDEADKAEAPGGPGSLSTGTAFRCPHLPNGQPSFSGPKGRAEHCSCVGNGVLTDAPPLEDQNLPRLIFETKRRPKGVTVAWMSVAPGFGCRTDTAASTSHRLSKSITLGLGKAQSPLPYMVSAP